MKPDKRLTLLNASPVHPGRGEPSRIELRVELSYLKNPQVVAMTLTHDAALSLATDLIKAARVVPA